MKYDLIIIGAGPAGVTAAVYAARQQLSILLLSKDIGGQVAKKAVDIENYPGFDKISGPELVELYKKQLQANNLAVTIDEVTGIEKKDGHFFVSVASGKVHEAISVISTSGAKSKLINVPGEEEFAGKGVSYCSLCDGPVFKKKDVVVVGGGNNGFETALFLSNYVKSVTVLEYGETTNADAENQELVAKNANIKVITNAKITRIEGKVFVNAAFYEAATPKAGEPRPEAGRDRATGEEKKLDVQGVFVEIGYSPSTAFLGDLVELNEKKEVMFNQETLETKTPGLFSAGDCNVSRYKQIVMASGEGAKAALSAYQYVKRNK